MELQQDNVAMVLAKETARRPADLFFRYVFFLPCLNQSSGVWHTLGPYGLAKCRDAYISYYCNSIFSLSFAIIVKIVCHIKCVVLDEYAALQPQYEVWRICSTATAV